MFVNKILNIVSFLGTRWIWQSDKQKMQNYSPPKGVLDKQGAVQLLSISLF